MVSRVAVAALVAIALGAGAVVAGRWEGRRHAADVNRGIERVRAAVGTLDGAQLYGYRRQPAFDCLVYRVGGNPYALELCVDGDGRIVEAIDRRGPERRFYSLRADPADATSRIDPVRVDALLRRMRASSS